MFFTAALVGMYASASLVLVGLCFWLYRACSSDELGLVLDPIEEASGWPSFNPPAPSAYDRS
jgi:hypothetical protein